MQHITLTTATQTVPHIAVNNDAVKKITIFATILACLVTAVFI